MSVIEPDDVCVCSGVADDHAMTEQAECDESRCDGFRLSDEPEREVDDTWLI